MHAPACALTEARHLSCVRACVLACVRACVRACMHAYAYTHTRIHAYTHTHTHTRTATQRHRRKKTAIANPNGSDANGQAAHQGMWESLHVAIAPATRSRVQQPIAVRERIWARISSRCQYQPLELPPPPSDCKAWGRARRRKSTLHAADNGEFKPGGKRSHCLARGPQPRSTSSRESASSAQRRHPAPY